MKVGRVLLVAALLATCTTSAALAGPKIMATAPAERQYPALQPMWCDIVNLNTSPKNVTIEAIDYFGSVVDGPMGPYLLQPNEAVPMQAISPFAAYCRFTVDGNPKKYRGVAVYDNGTEYTVAIPAQ